MIPFLITGLPRSRTAWMSAMCMMIPDAVCFHEPIEYAPSWEQSLEVWNAFPQYKFVGISDSGLGYHLEKIIKSHNPRILIIDRPLSEICNSLSKIGIKDEKASEVLHKRLSLIAQNDSIMRVKFSDLDEKIQECLDHLMPGAELDPVKIFQMQRLNVQVDIDRVKFAAVDRLLDLPKILGEDVFAELK